MAKFRRARPAVKTTRSDGYTVFGYDHLQMDAKGARINC